MGDLTTGYSWADGQTATPVRFNQALNDAVLAAAAISGKDANTNPALDSLLLLWDSADSALKKLTLANLLAAGVHSSAEKTALVAADEFLIWDSAASAAKRVTEANLFAVGSILQSVSAEITDYSTTYSAIIPIDDSVPQISEGSQILSVSITPKYASSKIRCRFVTACASGSGAVYISAALFRNSDANAIASNAVGTPATNWPTMLALEKDDSPATTSATTYTIRIGPQSGGYNMKINGAGNTRVHGGAARAVLVVEEIKQ